jgi:HAD superfamily hydrolase (TIGR01549 family)
MYKDYFDNKKLIIFDLDGTVVKSEAVWDVAFREVAKSLGLELIDTGFSGETVAGRWKQIAENNVVDLNKPISELVDATYAEFIKHLDQLVLTGGFWQFIAELKVFRKFNLALVTNTARIVVDKVIEHLELKEVFDFVICGDEIKKTKPDPEIYKKTLKHFNVGPKEALVFEDSLTGAKAAEKAGIELVVIWDGETPQMEFPDGVRAYVSDFTPFPGEMDTTYYEDILKMAEEQKDLQILI